ncbi:hypothetical protein DL769_001231 [Monosporascus sp. CRB-8-3]|nr:hypothetical protein DL769_001231 [Monosporascus sp. CRB-8-3]
MAVLPHAPSPPPSENAPCAVVTTSATRENFDGFCANIFKPSGLWMVPVPGAPAAEVVSVGSGFGVRVEPSPGERIRKLASYTSPGCFGAPGSTLAAICPGEDLPFETSSNAGDQTEDQKALMQERDPSKPDACAMSSMSALPSDVSRAAGLPRNEDAPAWAYYCLATAFFSCQLELHYVPSGMGRGSRPVLYFRADDHAHLLAAAEWDAQYDDANSLLLWTRVPGHPSPLAFLIKVNIRYGQKYWSRGSNDVEQDSERPITDRILFDLEAAQIHNDSNALTAFSRHTRSSLDGLVYHTPPVKLVYVQVEAPWNDKNTDLETDYRLQREESITMLRFSIRKFEDNPLVVDDEETCIYTKGLRHRCTPYLGGASGIESETETTESNKDRATLANILAASLQFTSRRTLLYILGPCSSATPPTGVTSPPSTSWTPRELCHWAEEMMPKPRASPNVRLWVKGFQDRKGFAPAIDNMELQAEKSNHAKKSGTDTKVRVEYNYVVKHAPTRPTPRPKPAPRPLNTAEARAKGGVPTQNGGKFLCNGGRRRAVGDAAEDVASHICKKHPPGERPPPTSGSSRMPPPPSTSVTNLRGSKERKGIPKLRAHSKLAARSLRNLPREATRVPRSPNLRIDRDCIGFSYQHHPSSRFEFSSHLNATAAGQEDAKYKLQPPRVGVGSKPPPEEPLARYQTGDRAPKPIFLVNLRKRESEQPALAKQRPREGGAQNEETADHEWTGQSDEGSSSRVTLANSRSPSRLHLLFPINNTPPLTSTFLSPRRRCRRPREAAATEVGVGSQLPSQEPLVYHQTRDGASEPPGPFAAPSRRTANYQEEKRGEIKEEKAEAKVRKEKVESKAKRQWVMSRLIRLTLGYW